MEEEKETLISTVHAGCHSAFEELIEALQDPLRDYRGQLPVSEVQAEFDKYKIWAGNVGAAHFGKRYQISLDYRLREAKFLKEQVLKLLQTLNDKVDSLNSLVRNKRKPFEEQAIESDSEISTTSKSEADDDEASDDSPWEISSESSEDGDNQPKDKKPTARVPEGSDSADKPGPAVVSRLPEKHLTSLGRVPTSEVPRLLESLKFTISCLYRMPIRKPAPLDRLKGKPSLDTSCYQHFDVLYIRDKFPQIDISLATRLGKMITRRRQILFYREAHKQSLDTARTQPKLPSTLEAKSRTATLKKGAEGNREETQSQSAPSRGAHSQTASSYFTLHTTATTVRPGDVPLNVPLDEVDPTALYAPSYAESKSSIASSYTGRDLRIRVPPRPKNDKGVELDWFECPYCFLTKNISTDRKWKKHVLEDIQPYVCTYGDCDLYDHFFDSKEAWFKHEAQHHRAKLFCNTEDHPEYKSENDFLLHMTHDHGQKMDNSQFALLKNMFRRPSRSIEGTCNLCMRPAKRLKSHLASHLQQIALFAVPIINETTGSGIAEQNSWPSKHKEKNLGESTDNGSGDSISSSKSEDADQEYTPEAENIVSAFDPEDDYEIGTEVPDAAEANWDYYTDKFSHARKGHFRPLTFAVLDKEWKRKEIIRELLRKLHCIEDSIAGADVVLLGSSSSASTEHYLAASLKDPRQSGRKVEITGLPRVIRISGSENPVVGFETDTFPTTWLEPPITSDKLEQALARACSWAPALFDWNPGRSGKAAELSPTLESGPIRFDLDDDGAQLPSPEPWSEQYVKMEFLFASRSVKYRLAQHMTAIGNQLMRSQTAAEQNTTRAHKRVTSVDYQNRGPKSTFMCCGSCTNEWLLKLDDTHRSNDLTCPRCGAGDIKDNGPIDPTDTAWQNAWPFFSLAEHNVEVDGVEISCVYCNSVINIPEQEFSPIVSAWRTHLLDDLKPFICLSEACEVPTARWGNYEAWKNHLEPNLFLMSDGVAGICPLCTNRHSNLIVHMAQHFLDLVGFCVSIYLGDIFSSIFDIESLATTERGMNEGEIADEDNQDLLTIGNCYTMAAPVPDEGKDYEWAFLGDRFVGDSSVSARDLEVLTSLSKLQHVRRPEESLSSSETDPYREVLLAKQIEFLDDQVDIKGSFWPLSLSQSCTRLKVQLRAWDEPCDTWELLEDMIVGGDDNMVDREGFDKQLKDDIQAIKQDYPNMPCFRINDLVTRAETRTIERVVNREAKYAGWAYYLVDQLSTPRGSEPPKGHWYFESELKPAETKATSEFYEALAPSKASNVERGEEDARGITHTDSLGEAADYYGDQGQSIMHQPGVRPEPPSEDTPVDAGHASSLQTSTEESSPSPVTTSANQPLSPETSYVDYLMPLLEKQMHILTWAMLEGVAREESTHLHHDLSKLLNHIKLSEFPYLKWSTFDSVVRSHIRYSDSSFEAYFDQLLKDGMRGCKDMPTFRIGDKVRKPGAELAETQQEYIITEGLYNDALGWVYGLDPKHADGNVFERDLVPVETGLEDPKPKNESDIYNLEAFLPFPCRNNNYCVKNFSTIEEREKHEDGGICRAEVDVHDRDRSVQLEVDPTWLRWHNPFCRHNDCTESFPTIEARNKHENGNCPYDTGGLRWQAANLSPEEGVLYGTPVPLDIKKKQTERLVSDSGAQASSSKQFECPYPECEMGPNQKSIFATEQEAETHACQEHYGCLMGCGRIWSVEHLRDLHHEECEGGLLT